MMLAEKIRELRAAPDRLLRMEQAASRAGRPEAAREIVDVCAELVARRGGEK
jgi:UDP-N-acetylglucosamine--N-acetylmuramyl-(pentapeptide) pyrophosphoryl-undecaprenol N-acetylglucosamine transferase